MDMPMSTVNEIATENVAAALAGPWSDALRIAATALRIERVSRGPYADSTTVFVVRDAALAPRAVLLCSARVAPEMVARTMRRTAQAHATLGGGAATRVLLPLMQGRLDGLSCALMPFCQPVSSARPLSWWHNRRLRPPIFDWLVAAARRTARPADAAALQVNFAVPLAQLARLPAASQRLRGMAAAALQRLQDGHWLPRQALMHGDLWRGNLMLRDAAGAGVGSRWVDRVVIIDWAGSRDDGYPLFDLIKIAASLGAGPARLRRELVRHCQILGCDETDVSAYLAAALADTLSRLENFPLADFLSMAEMCIDTLAAAWTTDEQLSSKIDRI